MAMRGMFALILVMAAAGCSHATTKYIHPNADIAALKTVAVLPFDNLTQERTAADKVQKIFTSELLSTGAFSVVEPGLVAKTLKAERIESTEALGPADVKRIGEALKAEGLFMGSVVDFTESRSGSTPAPEVTIQLRLVETQTGVTVWSVSRTRAGASVPARLFGVGGESLTEAARTLMKKELRTLVR
jgi:TolB-like protein